MGTSNSEGQERRMESRRENCKECPLVGGHCSEHVLLTNSWKWKMNLILAFLLAIMGGSGVLLLRVDTLGDSVAEVATGLAHHIPEYRSFQAAVGDDTKRLWEDIRDLRRTEEQAHDRTRKK